MVVESTYNWYWLVDGLMAEGYKVHLANTAAIQQYEGLKYTDDHSDARWLAHLLRLGLLPEGYIYPRAQRPVRDLLRKRSQLVRQRTTNVLSIQNLLTRNTGRSLKANQIKGLDGPQVDELLPDSDLALAVKANVAMMSSGSPRGPSGVCRGSAGFQAADIFVDLLLQLSKLLQRTFGEHGKVTRIAGQNLIAIRFKDTLHTPHLFNGLVNLFHRLNHNFILKIPFFMPGRCLIC
jgi:hypothetical protein